MTELELESEIKQDLIQADLFQDVDWGRCLFIDFPTFADIVLKDASKLEDVQRELAKTSARLLDRGIRLKPMARGAWEIETVRYAGAMPSKSGGIMRGPHYAVTLRCGARLTRATVGMSKDVEETLASASRMPAQEPERTAFLEQVVRSLVAEWLSKAGEVCWDPIVEPHRVVSAIPLRFALAQAV